MRQRLHTVKKQVASDRLRYILCDLAGEGFKPVPLLAVFSPLAAVSGAVSAGILRLFGIKSTNKADSVTEQEILMMVDAVNETGGIEESQAEMISNILILTILKFVKL